jgi:rfaE bifunctional protein kinase chain/domain
MREHVDQLGGHRILVIGDLILDRTVTGTVDRISPEAPVPVVSMPTTTHALGGAANVAAGVRALGSTPLLAGVTGDDDERVTMLGLLETAGIGRELIGVLPDRPTTLKTRIRAGAQQIARVDFEDRTDVDPKLVLARASDAFAAGVDAVILSDYAKGVLSDTVVTSVLADAFERGVPTIVDPKHTSPHRYARATLVTPNLAELRTWVDDDLDRNDLMAIGTAASAIAAEVSIEWVVVTMGQDGLLVCAPDGSHHHVPARPIAVFDVDVRDDGIYAKPQD